MAITPGTYLRMRREARGLTRDDLALMLETVPPVCAHRRAEWIDLIERDEMPIAASTIEALRGAFAFDLQILLRLGELASGFDRPAPQLCRSCACSWDDPCVDGDGQCCGWVPGDSTHCTACRDREATGVALPLGIPEVVATGAAA